LDKEFFIGENDFRVYLPDITFYKSNPNEDSYNSRKIMGIMTTDRKDRQGEYVNAKGLDFEDFLKNGHFNDNHSQATSAIVGYPESVTFHKSLEKYSSKLKGVQGWTCEGYVLKGTSRADGIWELAQSLKDVPDRKLGFSIEGKVVRRSDKTIESARIRNVAITNCPVNTDCTWNILTKSFADSDEAVKAMMAGYGTGPATQTGGGALRTEDLEHDKDKKEKSIKDVSFANDEEKKKKLEEAVKKSLNFDEIMSVSSMVLEQKPHFTEEAAITMANFLIKKGGLK
jgi:hypothetical protein